MGQNNIEKQIAEKLNAREIQPSAQAWDRLDAMLSVAEEKKTRRSFGWLYIAAGILVFLSVGTYLYNLEYARPSTNGVVTNDAVMPSEKVKSNPLEQQEKVLAPIQNTAKQAVAQNEQVVPISNEAPSQSPSKLRTQHLIRQKTNTTTPTIKNAQQPSSNQGAVAVVQSKKEEVIPSKITPVNQEEVAVNETTAASKVKVNANSLLSEVDGELELTFRDKVLKKVGKNYKEVKVALANRNLN